MDVTYLLASVCTVSVFSVVLPRGIFPFQDCFILARGQACHAMHAGVRLASLCSALVCVLGIELGVTLPSSRSSNWKCPLTSPFVKMCLYVYECFACICVCGTSKNQKRASDTPPTHTHTPLPPGTGVTDGCEAWVRGSEPVSRKSSQCF